MKSRPGDDKRKALSLRLPNLGDLELSNNFVNLGFSFKVMFLEHVYIKIPCHNNICITIKMYYLFKNKYSVKKLSSYDIITDYSAKTKGLDRHVTFAQRNQYVNITHITEFISKMITKIFPMFHFSVCVYPLGSDIIRAFANQGTSFAMVKLVQPKYSDPLPSIGKLLLFQPNLADFHFYNHVI